jgi:hypothetical protein
MGNNETSSNQELTNGGNKLDGRCVCVGGGVVVNEREQTPGLARMKRKEKKSLTAWQKIEQNQAPVRAKKNWTLCCSRLQRNGALATVKRNGQMDRSVGRKI